MKLVFVTFVAVVTTLSTPPLLGAQSKSPAAFGTCAYWHDRDRQADQPYLIGLAQGFVMGVASAPYMYVAEPSDALPEAILETFNRGWSSLLSRPSVLMEAFDTKCGDYRNRELQLADVMFLAALEIGGLSSARVESGLELLRARSGDPLPTTRRALIQLLIAPTAPYQWPRTR